MDAKIKNCVFATGLFLLGGYVCIEALAMLKLASGPPFNITSISISPGFLPLILGAALTGLALTLLVTTLRGETRVCTAFALHIRTCADTVRRSLANRDIVRAVIGVLIMAAYTFALLGRVPFGAGALVFLVTLMLFLRAGKARIILATSVVSVALIIGLFEYVFSTTLP